MELGGYLEHVAPMLPVREAEEEPVPMEESPAPLAEEATAAIDSLPGLTTPSEGPVPKEESQTEDEDEYLNETRIFPDDSPRGAKDRQP